MSLENNISKIMIREKEIENILVNSSNLKPSELANLSKELSDIKIITDLANKKEHLVKEFYRIRKKFISRFIPKNIKIFLRKFIWI